MKKSIIYKAAIAVSLLCFAIALLMFFTNGIASTGPFVIAAFILLAIGSRGYETMNGYAFTISIFAAVCCSLYYPHFFISWGDFKLSGLIIPLLQIIMFGMGTAMSVNDFVEVAKHPKGVFIGVVSHFIIMPSLGFVLAKMSGFPPEIAAGIVLVGCSPSGLASNVMSYLAKANLALSIAVTSCSTLLAPFVTPLLMKYLAGSYIQIDVMHMMFEMFKMIIIPIAAGLMFNTLFSGKSSWIDKAMPIVSMIGIAAIIVVITAAGRDSLLTIGPALLLIVLIHNSFGYLFGYWFARVFKMSESDSRTIAIEVGLQNAGLASGIAKGLGKIATVGLAAGVFGPVMNITGSMLASYWHKRVPENSK